MDVEVNNHTEITPPNTTVSNGNNNASKDGVPTGGYVIPYTGELVEAHRVPTSSGQRIKLQAEVNTDYKFLTICDPASPISFFLITKHTLFILCMYSFTIHYNHVIFDLIEALSRPQSSVRDRVQ